MTLKKITNRRSGPTDPNMQALIVYLSKKDQPAIYRRVSELANAPLRRKHVINVDQLDKLVNDGDVVVFPAKVLGSGNITKKITIGALKFSAEAARKINAAGGKTMSVAELWEKHPKGTNVRLLKAGE